MFYQQFEQQYQYHQQEQERRDLEILYKNQLLQQALLSTPPPSPMATALGHPNRSCASCKKRKVKCDRKTPSCTACQKSKHRCHYTSYSPPVLAEEPQQHNEDIKQKIEELDPATRIRWEQFQRMLTNSQPTMVTKDERGFAYANNPSAYYFDEDEALFIANQMMPSAATQFALPQSVSQQSSPQQLSPQPVTISAQPPYILQQSYNHPSSTETSPFIQTHNPVLSQENCPPYMRGIITLNYNFEGLRSLLGRSVAPYLERFTTGQGLTVPSTGFNDVAQLQSWIREKLSTQEWGEEMEQDERFDVQPIFEDVGPQQFSLRQRFEVTLHRVEFASSPTSVHEDFQGYEFEDKPSNMDMENYTTYSEAGSNQSSIADCDSTDVFLNKVYAFVRRFMRNHPWLRENFLMNLRAQSQLIPMGFDAFNDGVFSDVSVEVRKIYSYAPYQDLKIIQNNHEELVKRRLIL